MKYQIVIFWTATPPLLLTPPFVRWILEILGKIRHSGWNILSGGWGGGWRGGILLPPTTHTEPVTPAPATCLDSNTKLRKQCPEDKNDILNKRTNVVTINSPQRTSDPSFCSKTQLNEMKHSQTQMSTTFFLISYFSSSLPCSAWHASKQSIYLRKKLIFLYLRMTRCMVI